MAEDRGARRRSDARERSCKDADLPNFQRDIMQSVGTVDADKEENEGMTILVLYAFQLYVDFMPCKRLHDDTSVITDFRVDLILPYMSYMYAPCPQSAYLSHITRPRNC